MKKYTRLFLHSIITMVLCIGIATAMHDKDYSEQMLKSSGSHESSTGAPGEKTCTQSGCHDMCEIIKDDTTNALYVGDSSGYYTDNLAPIRLVVRKANTSKFGFQIVCLDSLNKNVGTWVLYNKDYVQTQNADFVIPAAVGRKYITHTYKGNRSQIPGIMEWVFAWNPPTDGYRGKITFYVMSNCSNDDNTSGGDKFYSSKHSFTYKSVNSVEEIIVNSKMNTFYNPSQHEITCLIPKQVDGLIKVTVLNINGKQEVQREYLPENNIIKVPLNQDFVSSGIKMIHCEDNAGISYFGKCVVN